MAPANQQTRQPPGAVHTRRAAILMLTGFAASYLQPPGNLLALVALVPAVVESVRALVAIQRSKDVPGRDGQTVWTALGLALSTLLIGMVVLPYLLWPVTGDYQECLRGANTAVAEARCHDQLDEGLSGLLGQFLPR